MESKMNYHHNDGSFEWQRQLEASRAYAMRTTEEINEEDDRVAALLKRNFEGARLGIQLAAEAEVD
jgi:hypothetical protein